MKIQIEITLLRNQYLTMLHDSLYTFLLLINHFLIPKEKDQTLDDKKEITKIIEYLNSRSGRRFKPDNKKTITLIDKLMSKGYSQEDIQCVIDLKVKEWDKVPTMRKYIRPSTLFDLHNFNRYLMELDSKVSKTSQS